MCTYILDISEVDRDEFGALKKMPDRIKCKMGIFNKEFDIVMDDIPKEAKEHSEKYYKEEGNYEDEAFNKPIGFDAWDLPVGAKLERID